MSYRIHGNIAFPSFTGARCYMMPFIQGDGGSLPDRLSQYAALIDSMVLERGEVGLLTIDERHVDAGTSQRGYGKGSRTLHTEACLSGDSATWGGATWGKKSSTLLERDVKALIANSIDDTCMVWDCEVLDTTEDGDLSGRADDFPRTAGRMMKAGEVVEIGIWTPHECIPQQNAGPRQFIRIVGRGVHGREAYFDVNEQFAPPPQRSRP